MIEMRAFIGILITCLASFLLSGCFGVYNGGASSSPVVVSGPFEIVQVTPNVDVTIRDSKLNLASLRIEEAWHIDAHGTHFPLRLVSRQADPANPHVLYLKFSPPVKAPFNITIVTYLGKEHFTIQVHYSGLQPGTFTSWKQLE